MVARLVLAKIAVCSGANISILFYAPSLFAGKKLFIHPNSVYTLFVSVQGHKVRQYWTYFVYCVCVLLFIVVVRCS